MTYHDYTAEVYSLKALGATIGWIWISHRRCSCWVLVVLFWPVVVEETKSLILDNRPEMYWSGFV